MAWHEMRTDPVPPDEAGLFRMRQGQEIGALARTLFPNGVLVSGRDNHASAVRTQAYIADGTHETVFEATALAAPFVAKADILTRIDRGWHVLEVKSSFSGTKDIEKLIDDLAYTVMVFQRFGVPVARASLLLLSREYRYGNAANRLFDVVDKTAEIVKRSAEFNAAADSCARALFHHEPPDPYLGSVCRECAVFGNECLGTGLAHTVLEIPGLHYKKLQQLAAGGIVDLSCLPDDLKLNDRQQRAVKSSLSGQLCVEEGLGDALEGIAWPCYYLDFETVATALPLYEGHGCHQQVLTQFSIHQRDRIDSELRHSEYLADATKDCQRELAEHLIGALSQRGSVLVYSPFEKTRIKALQELFPDLIAPLQAIIDRLVDLHPIIADHVYHPDFHGSFSIKKVLPALVPDLSYDDLDIRNGEAAITRFARMARREIVGDDIETTRQQLLKYCELDTFAMVRLHDKLVALVSLPIPFLGASG
jgi:predicted RecB family nuclease